MQKKTIAIMGLGLLSETSKQSRSYIGLSNSSAVFLPLELVIFAIACLLSAESSDKNCLTIILFLFKE